MSARLSASGKFGAEGVPAIGDEIRRKIARQQARQNGVVGCQFEDEIDERHAVDETRELRRIDASDVVNRRARRDPRAFWWSR